VSATNLLRCHVEVLTAGQSLPATSLKHCWQNPVFFATGARGVTGASVFGTSNPSSAFQLRSILRFDLRTQLANFRHRNMTKHSG